MAFLSKSQRKNRLVRKAACKFNLKFTDCIGIYYYWTMIDETQESRKSDIKLTNNEAEEKDAGMVPNRGGEHGLIAVIKNGEKTSHERLVELSEGTQGKEHEITFEELKEQAWELSEPTLLSWKERLEDFTEKHVGVIEQNIGELAALYGKNRADIPSTIVTGLHYYPMIDMDQGQIAKQNTTMDKQDPANHFAGADRIHGDIGHVLYWVSETSETDQTPQDRIDRRTADLVAKVLHESQHAFLHDEDFRDLVVHSENDPRIVPIQQRLASTQDDFIAADVEATAELITTYLDSYSAKQFRDARPEDQLGDKDTPIDFTVDKENCGNVLEAIIKTDVDYWKQDGPYSFIRKGWEQKIGTLPDGFQSVAEDEAHGQAEENRKQEQSEIPRTTSVYEIGKRLDMGLIKEYLETGKKIDIDFIARLYSMVDMELTKEMVAHAA
jgi:hypothetical protein